MRISDWSSDVCSSDLADIGLERVAAERNIVGDIRHHGELAQLSDGAVGRADSGAVNVNAVQIIDDDNVEFAKTFDNIGEVLGRDRGAVQALRSEERSVGEEWVRKCGSRWSRESKKKKKT